MVIDWLKSQHRGIAIYLCCSYKEEHFQTPLHMVGSLLKQIIQHKAALPDEVRSLYEQHLRKKTLPKLDELAKLLVQEVKTCSTVFVVINALDECLERGNTGGIMLDDILRLPCNARILITSEYSPTIEDRFESIPHIIVDIRATEEDVKRYVRACAEKERALAKHLRSSLGLMEHIVNTIAEESKGMFLLARLHMGSLSKELTRREVRAADPKPG
ncbi:hypothetical protein N657DRAFT_4087 [Parathielavia appendiculata]|uniref:Nephrocystin 3-like N-terminal domain-containing protein n=1 Tax=Parathielavia appendiculata TaxID=2587402 RepID=A0AAN6Z7N8_9PEZI|nr:hypothetical protein N657DRAFT_4087 [Parathielavia appendiculata]